MLASQRRPSLAIRSVIGNELREFAGDGQFGSGALDRSAVSDRGGRAIRLGKALEDGTEVTLMLAFFCN